jgi:hypothetical protein
MSRRPVLAALAIIAIGVGLAPEAAASTVHHPEAEIFATNNTATITDPNDPRLRTRLIGFGAQVEGIIAANGASSGPTTSRPPPTSGPASSTWTTSARRTCTTSRP